MKKTLYILLILCWSVSYGHKVKIGSSNAKVHSGSSKSIRIKTSPVFSLPVIKVDSARAFASCFGDGCGTITGGDAGKVYYVTDLDGNDNTPGTYNASTDSYSGTMLGALEDAQPFRIYFRVSGAIDAHTDPLDWFTDSAGGNDAQDDKTIIGASAPYPGIFIYGARWTIKGTTNPDNYIIRGLNVIRGTDGAHTAGNAFASSHGNLAAADNVFGWGNDETFGTGGGPNVVLRNLFTQGQQEGGEDKGGILGSFTAVGTTPQPGTEFNNVFFNQYRMFNITADDTDRVDVINNQGYSYGVRINSYGCGAPVTLINNHYTSRNSSETLINWMKYNSSTSGNSNCLLPSSIWAEGNYYRDSNSVIFDNRANDQDERTTWTHHNNDAGYGFTQDDQVPNSFFASERNELGYGLEEVIRSTDDAFTHNVVDKNVGARYYTDSNGDRQFFMLQRFQDNLEDIENQTTTSFISTDANMELADLSIPASGSPYTDSDNDGIPAAHETLFGLSDSDHTDAHGDTDFITFPGKYTIDNRERNAAGGLTGSNVYPYWKISAMEMQGDWQILLDYINDGLYH